MTTTFTCPTWCVNSSNCSGDHFANPGSDIWPAVRPIHPTGTDTLVHAAPTWGACDGLPPAVLIYIYGSEDDLSLDLDLPGARQLMDSLSRAIEATERQTLANGRARVATATSQTPVTSEIERSRSKWDTRIWFSTTQGADFTGSHRDTVLKALESGELHGTQNTKPKGRWRIHRECLDAWMTGEPCSHAEANK